MDYSRLSMPLGEAMFTQRSIRRFKPEPIPLADLRLIVEAAVKAPNGGNQQVARFLVVNDRTTIREFGPLYREAWWAKRRDEGFQGPGDLPPALSLRRRPGRDDVRRAVPRLRAGVAQRSRQLGHPRCPEPDARGARSGHRLRADDAPPVGNGSLPRDVRYPRRCRLSSLRPARLSTGQFRSDCAEANFGDDLPRAVGRSGPLGVTVGAGVRRCSESHRETDSHGRARLVRVQAAALLVGINDAAVGGQLVAAARDTDAASSRA
jgi:hypothetical protein